MPVLLCHCEGVERGGVEYHHCVVNPPAVRGSLSRRAGAAPAFGVHGSQCASNHYSPESQRRLTAAVYSVGGTMCMDRLNMMFTRVEPSSSAASLLPMPCSHQVAPQGIGL